MDSSGWRGGATSIGLLVRSIPLTGGCSAAILKPRPRRVLYTSEALLAAQCDSSLRAERNNLPSGALTGAPPDLTYTPGADFEGLDGFEFAVSDGENISLPGVVTVIVNPWQTVYLPMVLR